MHEFQPVTTIDLVTDLGNTESHSEIQTFPRMSLDRSSPIGLSNLELFNRFRRLYSSNDVLNLNQRPSARRQTFLQRALENQMNTHLSDASTQTSTSFKAWIPVLLVDCPANANVDGQIRRKYIPSPFRGSDEICMQTSSSNEIWIRALVQYNSSDGTKVIRPRPYVKARRQSKNDSSKDSYSLRVKQSDFVIKPKKTSSLQVQYSCKLSKLAVSDLSSIDRKNNNLQTPSNQSGTSSIPFEQRRLRNTGVQTFRCIGDEQIQTSRYNISSSDSDVGTTNSKHCYFD